MALDSLLASLKSGVAEVTGVQANRNKAFACNPARLSRVAEASGVAAEIKTATPERLLSKSEVTAQSAPTTACTRETPVTPKAIKCEVGAGDAASHAEILERHPDVVAAEPFTPTIRQPSAPMAVSEETAIRAWLALIEETDPATIAEVIGQCQRDADARDYFTRRAATEQIQRGSE